MDKEVLAYRCKLSADINATISTIAVWASIATICWILGGPTDAPMTAATLCTAVIWGLRKMQ